MTTKPRYPARYIYIYIYIYIYMYVCMYCMYVCMYIMYACVAKACAHKRVRISSNTLISDESFLAQVASGIAVRSSFITLQRWTFNFR